MGVQLFALAGGGGGPGAAGAGPSNHMDSDVCVTLVPTCASFCFVILWREYTRLLIVRRCSHDVGACGQRGLHRGWSPRTATPSWPAVRCLGAGRRGRLRPVILRSRGRPVDFLCSISVGTYVYMAAPGWPHRPLAAPYPLQRSKSLAPRARAAPSGARCPPTPARARWCGIIISLQPWCSALRGALHVWHGPARPPPGAADAKGDGRAPAARGACERAVGQGQLAAPRRMTLSVIH